MDEYESLSHTKWECKYHVIFIPKCRRKTLYGSLGKHLGEVFRRLAEQKQSRIEEGHLMPDHVHMMISIPPKYAVSEVVGFIKGKSAIHRWLQKSSFEKARLQPRRKCHEKNPGFLDGCIRNVLLSAPHAQRLSVPRLSVRNADRTVEPRSPVGTAHGHFFYRDR